MRFFRNPEIRRQLLWFLLCGAALTLIAYWIDPVAGATAAVCWAVWMVLHFVVTNYRYKRIAQLSRTIDALLHGEQNVRLSGYVEGELAILQSELEKLTVRLRQNADNLVRDKQYLADSLADISHQIRTPLTAMRLTVSLLGEPELSEERRMELARELIRLLARIDWLITALLKISKLDTGTVVFRKEPVQMAELVQKAAAPLAIPMELRGQTLKTQGEENVSFIGDAAWMQEALGNILKNCMEHTPPGGEISLQWSENAVYTELTVSDTGPGIDKADLPHLFERFYKGKNAGEQSVGIGLALARRIITGQNGIVKAENRPEGGARFVLRFYKNTV